ncbi:MAG: UDP-N-acetylmuramoyl-tripeptide--D-alanyl-D-alanine ligase [Alphaproteobacteria bacterium]|nr:UDP-N-acetylmuramoyl-tripeptide--D-alanyl-D-alanine ligase [Alphaproteobacteria bacterium]
MTLPEDPAIRHATAPSSVPASAVQAASPLWTAYEVAAATGGALCARPSASASAFAPSEGAGAWIAEEWTAAGISIDTRSLRAGDIFVALKAARDGHEFLDAAFRAGASAALVDTIGESAPRDAPLVVVEDALAGLTRLATAARRRNFGKRVAITGSAGKTSTKEMMRTVFSGFGEAHAADKSLNNHIGVPLTLARMPLRADFGVFEIGMNHAGEITPLVRLVQPHVAIITTVGEAHLENFPSVEGIARAKAEIMLGLVKGGVAVLPIDNEHFDLLAQLARDAGVERIMTFGENARADVRLLDYQTDGIVGHARAFAAGSRLSFEVGAPGRHQAMNALAVLAAAYALGLPVNHAAARLARFGAGGGRGLQRMVRLDGGRRVAILDESYNANPSSARAAIALLGAMTRPKGGRKIVVLGDMLELGPDSPALHAGLLEALLAAGVDKVYSAGALARHLYDAAPDEMKGAAADDAATLSELVKMALLDGDIVMVKGSNASKVSRVVDALVAADVSPADAASDASINSGGSQERRSN